MEQIRLVTVSNWAASNLQLGTSNAAYVIADASLGSAFARCLMWASL